MIITIIPADRELLCDVLGCSDAQRAQIMACEKDDLPRVKGGLQAIAAYRQRYTIQAAFGVSINQEVVP